MNIYKLLETLKKHTTNYELLLQHQCNNHGYPQVKELGHHWKFYLNCFQEIHFYLKCKNLEKTKVPTEHDSLTNSLIQVKNIFNNFDAILLFCIAKLLLK